MQRRDISLQAGPSPLSRDILFTVMSLRFFWVLNLLLGLIFWFGWVQASGVPLAIHIALGSLVVLSLWYLGLAASRLRVHGMPTAALFIGVLLVLAGLGQLYFGWWQGLPAAIVHLVLALAAIGVGEGMVGSMRRAAARPRI
jgi:hypothetical protein